MVKEIIRDPIFLAGKSEAAVREDTGVGADLLDTLRANADRCVGMAANMIGVRKRIIVFDNGGIPTVLYNPEILHGSQSYETEEGCLSLDGTRRTKRYKTIRVRYQNGAFQTRTETFTGWTAQIIQHEIDHCNGILI